MRGISLGTYRAKHRRRGQGPYEYRIYDGDEIVAVCLTPQNAQRVYDALAAAPTGGTET